jgi:cytochrome c oxidase subunit II
MNNNQMIITALVVVLVLVGGFFGYKAYKASKNAASPTVTATQAPTDTSMPADTSNPSASGSATQGTTKEFTVTGQNFSFSPTTLTVNKGDTVKITFKNAGGMHDIVFPDFKAQSKVIQAGASDTITFTADKTGSFEYFCSVGNHRAMGMKGTLVVQ